MPKFFRKKQISMLVAVVSFSAMNSSLIANDCCYPCSNNCYSKCNRFYIGVFGGGLYSDSTEMIQRGTAFFTEAMGGPLAIDARGHIRKTSSGYGGIQVGYEWAECPYYIGCSDWSISTAAEVEGYWYGHKKRGLLSTPSAALPEHDFRNSFKMGVGVYMLNAVFAINTNCLWNLTPYVGGGIGAANLHIRKATATQITPEEPGVNHYNSDRNDSTWAFAAQAKAGLRYNFCDSFHIFGEYRFLYVDSSQYLLGSTVYPNHVPTTPWNVEVKSMCYNAFAVGIQFDL